LIKACQSRIVPATAFQAIDSLHSLQPPWIKPRTFEANQNVPRGGTDFAPSPMLLTMVSNRPAIDRRNPEIDHGTRFAINTSTS
jgi:hypothetical protein